MGFYVYVWHEAVPITADAALAKLERDDAGEVSVFADHPAVPALLKELLTHFPALEDLEDDELDTRAVWNSTPEPSNSLLHLGILWSRAAEAHSVIKRLAREHGLVCYEPGSHTLDPNAPGHTPHFTLTTERLGEFHDPDQHRIEWAVSKLSNDNFFATLTRADGSYVQIGYGTAAGVTPGTYALEYQEGSTDQHYASHTTDITVAKRFMKEFLTGEDAWKRRHGWRHLTL